MNMVYTRVLRLANRRGACSDATNQTSVLYNRTRWYLTYNV